MATAGRWAGRALGVAAAAYGASAVRGWLRYGRITPPSADEADPLLDRFMSQYEVVERHHIRVAAPASIAFAAACDQPLLELPVVRAIVRLRELALGATPDTQQRPQELLPYVQSLGWSVLADRPGREIVVGAVTRPWEPNVTFRAVAPDLFAAFSEPDSVKIAWTLRADPITATTSIFRTETRAIATDSVARAKFRRYWACFSPGIGLIRWLSLGPLKKDAERRARGAALPRS